MQNYRLDLVNFYIKKRKKIFKVTFHLKLAAESNIAFGFMTPEFEEVPIDTELKDVGYNANYGNNHS